MGADDALVVPVIDISPFVAAAAASSTIDAKEDLQEQCNETAKEWDQAMSTVGFALIVGHGVDPSTIENLRKGLRSFFEDQSIDYKSGFLYGPYGGPKGGYTAGGPIASPTNSGRPPKAGATGQGWGPKNSAPPPALTPGNAPLATHSNVVFEATS